MSENPYSTPTTISAEESDHDIPFRREGLRPSVWLTACAIGMSLIVIILWAMTAFLGFVVGRTHSTVPRNWLLFGGAASVTACCHFATYQVWRYRSVLTNASNGEATWREYSATHSRLWFSFFLLTSLAVLLALVPILAAVIMLLSRR